MPDPARVGRAAFSPRLAVLWLVTLVCVSLVALQVWRSWTARDLQLLDTQALTANLAHSLSQHANDTIKQVELALSDVAERVESNLVAGPTAEQTVPPAALRRLSTWLGQLHVELPQLHDFVVIDRSGQPYATQDAIGEPQRARSWRGLLALHRGNADLGATLGPPVRAEADGAWVVTLSRRLNDGRGRFAGVAVASISIAYFTRFHALFDIGPDASIAVLTDRGTYLSRTPANRVMTGLTVADPAAYVEDLRRNPVATYERMSSSDGVVRIYSRRHLPNYGLVMVVAQSRRQGLATWRQDNWLHMGSTLIVMAGLLLMSRRLLGQIAIHERAESDLRLAHARLDLANRELSLLAFRDGLTGLANRRAFDLHLTEELLRARRSQNAVALVLMDIDHFKRYNDSLGHVAGDGCLSTVGEALARFERRSGDLAARYGGEEFALILSGADLDGALIVAERVRCDIQALALPHPGNPTGVVTVSVGVACLEFVMSHNTQAELIEAADTALYAAKNAGRNRVMARQVREQPDILPAPRIATGPRSALADGGR